MGSGPVPCVSLIQPMLLRVFLTRTSYTQMFGAALDADQDWNAPQKIHDALSKLLDNIENLDAVGRPRRNSHGTLEDAIKRDRLKIILTKHSAPLDLEEADLCAAKKGYGPTQAFVTYASQLWWYQNLPTRGGSRYGNKGNQWSSTTWTQLTKSSC